LAVWVALVSQNIARIQGLRPGGTCSSGQHTGLYSAGRPDGSLPPGINGLGASEHSSRCLSELEPNCKSAAIDLPSIFSNYVRRLKQNISQCESKWTRKIFDLHRDLLQVYSNRRWQDEKRARALLRRRANQRSRLHPRFEATTITRQPGQPARADRQAEDAGLAINAVGAEKLPARPREE
jgi:hypothetical protein